MIWTAAPVQNILNRHLDQEPVQNEHLGPVQFLNRHLDLVAGSKFFLGASTIFEPAPRSKNWLLDFSNDRYNFWTGFQKFFLKNA